MDEMRWDEYEELETEISSSKLGTWISDLEHWRSNLWTTIKVNNGGIGWR